MEGIDDKEMNEFVKKNPEYAEDFYKQMKDKYSNKPGFAGEKPYYINSSGVWIKDPLKFP